MTSKSKMLPHLIIYIAFASTLNIWIILQFYLYMFQWCLLYFYIADRQNGAKPAVSWAETAQKSQFCLLGGLKQPSWKQNYEVGIELKPFSTCMNILIQNLLDPLISKNYVYTNSLAVLISNNYVLWMFTSCLAIVVQHNFNICLFP